MKTPPKRAKKGSVDTAVLVRMDGRLREQVHRAARREGVSDSEWLRSAARERLARG